MHRPGNIREKKYVAGCCPCRFYISWFCINFSRAGYWNNGPEPADLVACIAILTSNARRQAQFEQLDYMTRIADEAIEALRLGKRAAFPQHHI